MWHWGRAGAGARFTFSLASGVGYAGEFDVAVSSASRSDLTALTSSDDTLVRYSVTTFEGDKSTWQGKVAAGLGLLGLPKISRDFDHSIIHFKPDLLVCAFQSIWDFAALPVISKNKLPFVLVLHDAEPHPGDSYPMRHRVLSWEVNKADALIVLSNHVAHEAHRLYGFPREHIHIIPHGAFEFGEPTRSARSLKTSAPVNLLFFGRIVEYKGLGLLLSAYRLLKIAGIPVRLSIVGSGDLRPYRLALGALDDITIDNRWIDEAAIASALRDADILVLPYIEASQSGVAAAAQTAGLPIVATPVGGLIEQVKHGVTGLVSDEVSAAALAASLTRLISDPSLYNSCSSESLAHARDDLDWTTIGQRVGLIFDEVLLHSLRNGTPARRTG
jgi:glycosyltransferase involved in cell wall biosynthesis